MKLSDSLLEEDEEKEPSIMDYLSKLIGEIAGVFFLSVGLFFGYKWLSTSFNLPHISYLQTVAVYASIKIICNAVGDIFRK